MSADRDGKGRSRIAKKRRSKKKADRMRKVFEGKPIDEVFERA